MTLRRRLTIFTVIWCTCILALLNAVAITWFRSQAMNRLYQTLVVEMNDVVRFNQEMPHLAITNNGWETKLLLVPSSIRFIDANGRTTSGVNSPGFSVDALPVADASWQRDDASAANAISQSTSSGSASRFHVIEPSTSSLSMPIRLPVVSTPHGGMVGVEQSFAYPDNQPGRVVVATPLTAVSQDVQQFEQSMFLADGAVLLVLAVGTYVVTLRGLRPLSQLMDQIQRAEWSSRPRIHVHRAPMEVTQLADTINQQLERIEAGVLQQRRFIADASHELRTPLAILAGHANLLRRWGATNPEVWQPAVRHITSEVERLQRLVDTLILQSSLDDWTKHGERQSTEAMVVRDMINQLVTDGKLLRPDITWTSDVKLPLRMLVDMPTDALRQALIIVVDNGVRYTGEHGAIDISASLEERQVRITVTDTGYGITPEDLPHVFERFYRGAQARQTPGTGLGLSICKQLVESVGGRIYLDSATGRGTRVSLLVPVMEVSITR